MLNYPLKFKPILKEKIWGGTKLKNILNKRSNKNNIGESWEISDVDMDQSMVINGSLRDQSLKDLIKIYKAELIGKKVYEKFGENFPLLIKYIDAKEALSIQLHPNDALAKQRHNSFGKTEMWYVMQADDKAELIVGFKNEISKEAYLNHLQNKTLTEILNIDLVKEGDVYFIPTGRVHAIGAGVLLAEIQQTSDVTYRIYDWDRQDSEGNYRDLHTEEALDALELTAMDNYQTSYKNSDNIFESVVDCNYFTTSILTIDSKLRIDNSNKDSFIIYMCVGGQGVRIETENHEEVLRYGETILVPAVVDSFNMIPLDRSKLLEIYIK